jgi:hypothetical protein
MFKLGTDKDNIEEISETFNIHKKIIKNYSINSIEDLYKVNTFITNIKKVELLDFVDTDGFGNQKANAAISPMQTPQNLENNVINIPITISNSLHDLHNSFNQVINNIN